MLLIDDIKSNVENKFNHCFIFTRLFREGGVGSVQNKTSFVSLCVRFVGGNKKIIQKKRERIIDIVYGAYTKVKVLK